MADEKKINMVCTHCGSEDVRQDADAMWNVDTQKWELAGLYDNTTCDQCGGECRIKEVEIKA